jgi:hypothetical protein
MEFRNKWINWVIESGNTEVLEKIGTKCYMDNEWTQTLPKYNGKKTKEDMMLFLRKHFNEFSYTETEKGFTVSLNNSECYCPLIKEKITDNPALCECTKNFDRLMYENILGIPVKAEIIETILRDKTSCTFEIILPESL